MTPTIRRAALERCIALVLLLVSLPVLAAVATWSAVVYRTWPFFIHDRVGENEQRFRFVKVRTLPRETRSDASKGELNLTAIPRSMRLIRRTHLDELPQLLHVVSGKMRFVGPRPELPRLHEQLSPTFAQLRCSVPPGITGLWQIGRDCHDMIGDHPEYDIAYVQHRSAALDLWIMRRTVGKMLAGETVARDQIPSWVFGERAKDLVVEPSRN